MPQMDKATESQYLSLSFALQRGTLTSSKTISLDIMKVDDATWKQTVSNYRQLILNSYNKLIQPADWRDSDLEEEEWVTTDITVKYTTKVEVTFDFGS